MNPRLETAPVRKTTPAPPREFDGWVTVLEADKVPTDRGIALVAGETTVALFRLRPLKPNQGAEEWYAISNTDPKFGAPVLARGLVGSLESPDGSIPIVSSPLLKQRYDLRTGRCLDTAGSDESETLDVEAFAVRIVDDWVQIRTLK